jgi:hypothetical protein
MYHGSQTRKTHRVAPEVKVPFPSTSESVRLSQPQFVCPKRGVQVCGDDDALGQGLCDTIHIRIRLCIAAVVFGLTLRIHYIAWVLISIC